MRTTHIAQPLRSLAAGAFFCALLALPGCTVVAVGAAAVSVTATVVGVAADAAVGTAKIVGKGVGKAYDAMTEEDAPDTSGVHVRYRDTSAAPTASATVPTPAAAVPQPVAPSTAAPITFEPN